MLGAAHCACPVRPIEVRESPCNAGTAVCLPAARLLREKSPTLEGRPQELLSGRRASELPRKALTGLALERDALHHGVQDVPANGAAFLLRRLADHFRFLGTAPYEERRPFTLSTARHETKWYAQLARFGIY